MSYFDALINASFKSDADGNTVFFPYGNSGKGRLLANNESKEQIKNFLARFYMVSFSLILLGTIAGDIWMLLAVPVLLLWYDRGIKKLLNDAPIADAKLSRQDIIQNIASRMNKYLIWFFLISSFLFVALSIFLMIETNDLLLGLGGGAFFTLCGITFVLILRSKKNS